MTSIRHTRDIFGWRQWRPFGVRGLTWMKRAYSGKKMLECTYIMREEKCAPGFKAFKDRFTRLLGANLTGDWKLKPVLVYHTENSRALKGYEKNRLPVHWCSNSSGWMMGHIFQEYSKMQLLGELKEYCLSPGFPFKILMVLDNAPAHPQMLQDLHSNIKFIFLLPNTTSLLQLDGSGCDPYVQGTFPAEVVALNQPEVWCVLGRAGEDRSSSWRPSGTPEGRGVVALEVLYHPWRPVACVWCLEGGDAVLHPGVVEEAVSTPLRRLRGLRPFRGALKGAPQVPRVGEEGRPRWGRGRRLGIVVGVDRRGADDVWPRRSGEAAASVG